MSSRTLKKTFAIVHIVRFREVWSLFVNWRFFGSSLEYCNFSCASYLMSVLWSLWC